MCLFNNSVDSVKKTNILVCLLKDGRQFTAYQNEVVMKKKTSNAMVLPAPLTGDFALVDLSSYPNLFNDCNHCFPKKPAPKSLFSRSKQSKSLGKLEVHQVGSYKVRFVNFLIFTILVLLNVWKI